MESNVDESPRGSFGLMNASQTSSSKKRVWVTGRRTMPTSGGRSVGQGQRHDHQIARGYYRGQF